MYLKVKLVVFIVDVIAVSLQILLLLSYQIKDFVCSVTLCAMLLRPAGFHPLVT